MDELWDIARLSQHLCMKKSTLYAMIERKEIPHYRIGKLARFNPTEIEEWLLGKRRERQSGKDVRRAARKRSSPPSIASQIVKAAIDQVNPERYNRSGKSDRIKGLEKEG